MKLLKLAQLVALSTALFFFFVPESNAQFGKLKKKLGLNDGGGAALMTKSKVSTPGDPYGKCSDFQLEFKEDHRGRYYEVHFDIGKGLKKGTNVFSMTSSEKLTAYANEGDSVYYVKRSPMLKDPNGDKHHMTYFARAIRTSDGVYLCYYAGGGSETGKAGTPTFAREKVKMPLVIAPSEEKHDEWFGEKGTKYVQAFEDKLKAAYEEAKNSVVADARMPKAGKLHKDEKLLEAAKKGIPGRINGAELKRVVITSNDWKIIHNSLTGLVIKRVAYGYFADHMPDREDPCRVFTFSIEQQHDGKKFYGEYRVTGIGQDPKILRIDCGNIDK